MFLKHDTYDICIMFWEIGIGIEKGKIVKPTRAAVSTVKGLPSKGFLQTYHLKSHQDSF